MKLRPFDSSVNEDFSMYDNLPYQKDLDLCGPDKIALESGNIIKFFRCNMKDTYQFTGIDDLYYEKLKLHQEKQPEMETEKNALEKLADSLLPEDTVETVEDPQLAENEPSKESHPLSDAEALLADSQEEHWDDDWA